MDILVEITTFINNILLALLDGTNYVIQSFNSMKSKVVYILVNTHKTIEQYQTDNPEGFVLLASTCIIFCLCAFYLIGTYKIVEDAKYKEFLKKDQKEG